MANVLQRYYNLDVYLIVRYQDIAKIEEDEKRKTCKKFNSNVY